MVDNINEEYKIINQVISVIHSKQINILSKPDNNLVLRFKNGGFEDDNHKIYRNKFYFIDNKAKIWDDRILIYNKELEKKITFIKNYDNIKKVPDDKPEKVKQIYSISNPMFSEDGKYAIVNVSKFTNYQTGGSYEGNMYVFERKDDEWIYIFTYVTALS